MSKSDRIFIDSTSNNRDHELETILKHFSLSTSAENKKKLEKDLERFREFKGANIKRDDFYKFFEKAQYVYDKASPYNKINKL
ncbi:hypothetical protein [Gilliamella sp. ESL0254]|uniref:hypothetical protein n=1 Tax=Gilliamella sp. ESL0254 TaxID=2705035 RepID=UPI00157FF1F7|nr:hypothetical protein [Gilliamella sp. ESL0254]NUF26894.1 hypothetical protein [Gilliamella sp. ESL0254]